MMLKNDFKISCEKSWFFNLRKIIINYKHMGEANNLYLVHMTLPKIRDDRMGYYPKIWRGWCR